MCFVILVTEMHFHLPSVSIVRTITLDVVGVVSPCALLINASLEIPTTLSRATLGKKIEADRLTSNSTSRSVQDTQIPLTPSSDTEASVKFSI